MNKSMKVFIGIVVAIFVAGGSLAYGAMTAKQPTPSSSNKVVSQKMSKEQLAKLLTAERPTIDVVMLAAYPKISTDYAVGEGQLFDEGKWFGATLTYKGSDIDNRDTLRILMQKKNGLWTVHTTPPEPLLSHKKYPDVPIDILKTLNKPIGLPAGGANSPAINPAG